MEKRKNNYTPRERIDDRLLLEILRENEPSCTGYGNHESESRASDSHNSQAVDKKRKSLCDVSLARGNTRMYSDSNESDNGSGCNEKCTSESCINGYALAMVYCPDQDWSDLYGLEEALERGTLFHTLDLPFYGAACASCR